MVKVRRNGSEENLLVQEGMVMIMLTKKITKRSARTLAALLLLFALGTAAIAVHPGSFGPDGMVTGGTELVSGSVGSVTGSDSYRSINTTGQETILTFDRFNVWEGWTVNFQQPNASAATLNRVTGGCGSEIMGSLTSNGQVFLINPAGIVFGRNSVVNMPKLVASGLNLSNDEFRKLARSPLNDSETVTFLSPRYGGRVEMLWDEGEGGILQPGFNVDKLYLIGTQVENCAKIQGYSPDTNPYVVMAASTGQVIISRWDQQNIAVQVLVGSGSSDTPPAYDDCDECDRHKHQVGQGHHVRGGDTGNGYGYGHYGKCGPYPCYTTPLGAGDIISLAVVDTDLIAMAAERNILTGSLESDGAIKTLAVTGGTLVEGHVAGQSVSMEARKNNQVDGDVTGIDSVYIKSGNSALIQGDIESDGGITTISMANTKVGGSVEGASVVMLAGGNNEVMGDVKADGPDGIVMTAGHDNKVGGSVLASDGDVAMTSICCGNEVGGDVRGENVTMTAYTHNSVGGNVTATAGDVMMLAQVCYNYVAGDVTGSNITMVAGTDNHVVGNVDAGDGDVVMTAGRSNIVDGSVEATNGDVVMTAVKSNTVNGSVTAASGDITMLAQYCSNYIGGDASADNIYMTAGRNNTIAGDAYAVAGQILINSGSYTYLGGSATAVTDVTVNSTDGLVLNGSGDQIIEAITGKVEISAPLTQKITEGHLVILGGSPDLAVNLWTAVHTAAGNIEIKGLGNIQLGGELIAGGSGEIPVYHGVSVISDAGEIYTGEPGNGINVLIKGGSDQAAGIGVGLPHDADQKAAIVLISSAPLTLGPDAKLIAVGKYYGADGPVDDRAAVKFRNQSDWQGLPIDIAVYVQSTNGDVIVDHLGILDVQDLGTVALDAKTRMLLVNQTDAGVEGPYYLYRLEVASRDTIWLSEAIANGTHPFASDPSLMESLMGGGTYVMRGGVNPEGIEGAWVLHDPEPVVTVTAQLPAPLAQPVDEGCPALLLAAAEEIGQDPAVFRNGILVNARNMQPCDTCQRLLRNADVLKDVDGTRLTALGQVLNEFVTTQAPPSPEQLAAINQAIAMHVKDGTAYAAAGQWVDALAAYVGILRSEIGLSQADALAVAMGKYGSPEKANEAVKAFIALRLAELAG